MAVNVLTEIVIGRARFQTGVQHPIPRRILRYTYEIVERVPGRRLVMRTAEGPFLSGLLTPPFRQEGSRG